MSTSIIGISLFSMTRLAKGGLVQELFSLCIIDYFGFFTSSHLWAFVFDFVSVITISIFCNLVRDFIDWRFCCMKKPKQSRYTLQNQITFALDLVSLIQPLKTEFGPTLRECKVMIFQKLLGEKTRMTLSLLLWVLLFSLKIWISLALDTMLR